MNTLFNLIKDIEYTVYKREGISDVLLIKRLDIIDEILNIVGDLPEYMKGSYRYVSFLEYREKLAFVKPKYGFIYLINLDMLLRNILKELDKEFSGLMCAFNSIILLKRIKPCKGGYLDQHLRLHKGPDAIKQIFVENHKSIIKLFINTLSIPDDKDFVHGYWINQNDKFYFKISDDKENIIIKMVYYQNYICPINEQLIQFLNIIGFECTCLAPGQIRDVIGIKLNLIRCNLFLI